MSYLVMMRHGESLWNRKNIFTGWVDVPLSERGIREAQEAGEKISRYSFDVVFVSTLVRAMETAMLALSKSASGKVPVIVHAEEGRMRDWSRIYSAETEAEVLPVYQAWQLNERYYGELQGLNKADTAERYGADQVQLWRRSYDVPPPSGEALLNTAERTIPFFNATVEPILKSGKNVFISAHGNSLRSIVMRLDHLTREEVLHLELATGDPLFYEFKDGNYIRKGS